MTGLCINQDRLGAVTSNPQNLIDLTKVYFLPMLHVQYKSVIMESGRRLSIIVTKELRPEEALSQHDSHDHRGCGRDVLRTALA